MLFMFLASLKHCGKWDVVASVFKIKPPTFQKMIMSFASVVSSFLYEMFAVSAADKYTMETLGNTFRNNPCARYATDVIFQQTNMPSGQMKEPSAYYSENHHLHGYKVEVSVLPNGLAINCTNHFSGSEADIDIFRNNAKFHQQHLLKSNKEKELVDDGALRDKYPETWVVLADEGYQGLVEDFRAITPFKKPRMGCLTIEQVNTTDGIARDRAIVENYFGRLGTLWALTSSSTFIIAMVFASLTRCARPAPLRLARRLSTYKPDIEAVKKLRAESQAPLKDVRAALVATSGDFPAAFEWLRKKGIATASKKAGRHTAEGLVGVQVADDGLAAAMVEVNSETDFVAMNDKFQALVSSVAGALAQPAADAEVVTQLPTDKLALVEVDGAPVADKVPELIGVVGENVVANRAVQFQLEEGTICSYLHNVAAPGLGRAGALVALQFPSKSASAEQVAGVKELGHRLVMHIVAAKPRFLSRETVPEALVEKERAFLADQVKDSGKPAHIVAKMTEGRLNKFFGEFTLLEQDHFIEEGNPKIGAFVAEQGKKLGVDVAVAAYERFEVGEGKEEEA
ncbi:hypothetical protein PF004_g10370 [Phytophthora fragariae]|uniref:Elongation factor Ts, mitochondrial n=1 Tax=Phytophthora fragariae TaxID=53985 RepID=A0A6G0P1E3_9STRA|nr:hypothetical protein PF004_g10370 [Phytophthora fragariae]